MSKITDTLISARLSRRMMLTSGGAMAAGMALCVPAIAAAATPALDTSFKDFTIPKFEADDSLVKIQKKGEIQLCTSNDWPYS